MIIPNKELIQAALDGKTIQWRDRGDFHAKWVDYANPANAIADLATDESCEYRLKPKRHRLKFIPTPQEPWIAIKGDA